MKKKASNSIAGYLTAIFLCLLGCTKVYDALTVKSSDDYIKERVVELKSEIGLCSGVQIKAPSGNTYILTAGHCAELLKNDEMTAVSADGSEHISHLVALDVKDDLMLMTAPSNRYIDVAKNNHVMEHVRTLTHGEGFPTYKTEGMLLIDREVHIPLFPVINDEMADKCKHLGADIEPSFTDICVITFNETFSTARVVPGSSGGPGVDDKGELIGIVSISDGEMFSGFVPLDAIHGFLADK